MSKPSTLTVKAADEARPVPFERVSQHVRDKRATLANLKRQGVAPDAARAEHLVFKTMIYGSPVEVPNSRYYRRRIANGDLVVVEAAVGKARGEKKEG